MGDKPNFLMNSWDLYKGQLLTLFGNLKKLRNIENKLDALYMKDSDNASSYIASFRSIKSRLEGWSDHALMHSFRKGLPLRILDLLDQQPGDINTLSELVNATLKIDIRHQERVRERRRDNNFRRNDTNFRPAPSNRQMDKRPAPPRIVCSNPTQSTSQASTSRQLVRTPAEISKHLGTDGKLHGNELQQREKLGLCLYCGGKHKFEDCEKRAAKKARITVL